MWNDVKVIPVLTVFTSVALLASEKATATNKKPSSHF